MTEPPPREIQDKIDDHLFTPSQLVIDPFTSTYFSTTFGGGYGLSRAPGFNAVINQNEPNNKTADRIASATESFLLQVGILDGWAIRIGGAAVFASPFDGTQLLTNGASVQYLVTTGTTLSFRLGSHARVGATVDYVFDPDFRLYVSPPANAPIGSPYRPSPTVSDLLTPRSPSTIVPGMTVAFALHQSLGVILSAQYLHDFTDVTGLGNTNRLAVSAAVDLDFRQLNSIPIGFVAAYKMTTALNSNPSIYSPIGDGSLLKDDPLLREHQFNLGMYYTGDNDLVAGPEVNVLYIPNAVAVGNVTSVAASFVVRYFF